MRRITALREFADLTDDPLLQWAAQDLRPGVQIWSHGDAVGVGVNALSGYDRLALSGPVGDAAHIATVLLPDGLRPIGDADLIEEICERVPQYSPTRVFGWMDTTTPVPADDRVHVGTDDDAVAALLREAFPTSTTWPGVPGVQRWWVVTQDDQVVASAAECFCASSVGYLSGVASSPAVRGQGLGRAVVTTTLHHLVERYGRAGLLADEQGAARSLYESLGLRWRPLRAAAPSGSAY